MRIRFALFGIVATVLSLSGILAAEEREGDRLGKIVAPFVEEQTMVVAHLDVMGFDPAETIEWFTNLFELPASARDKMRADAAPINVITQSLPRSATVDVLVVSSFADLTRMPFFLVMPVNDTVPAGALAAEIRRDLEKDWGRTIASEEIAGALVTTSQETINRLKKGKTRARPEIAAALEAAGEAPARVAFVPSASLRALVEGILPESLPQQLGGGPTRAFTQGVVWMAAGVELPPDEVAIRLTIQSADTAAAAALEKALADLYAAVGQVPAVRSAIPNFGELSVRLLPKSEGDRLLLELTEDNQGITALKTLLAPILGIVSQSFAAK